jgi:DNA-binding NarL/FixJ family response regulator
MDQVLTCLRESIGDGPVWQVLMSSCSNPKPIQLLIADDHTGIRAQVASQLDVSGDIEVVGQAGDGFSAVALALCTCPDVVLLDYRMPHFDGAEACRRLQSLLPSTRVVGWTSQEGRTVRERFLAAGAVTCVLKSASPESLRHAIRAAVEPAESDDIPGCRS